jgi:hypothetical protein
MGTLFDVFRARDSIWVAGIALIAGLADAIGISRANNSAGWAAGLLLIAGLATAADTVYPNAEAAQPLQAGASVPSVSVRAVDGSVVDLVKLVSQSGALLVFYRGGW